MNNKIMNPETGKLIKVGGATHKKLVLRDILSEESLKQGTIPVLEQEDFESRQRMKLVNLEFFSKSTHWTNVVDVAESIRIPQDDDIISVKPFHLVEYISKDFDNIKIIKTGREIRIIFEGYEPGIQNIINDYIKYVLEMNKQKSNY